ncbi:MAG: D-alanyl-D-alanine carboxypeptidase/D-alanyl-D-alanine-endopeptidase [Flavobacteriia bacterium]|nr:D-alanyl-D-alanine carboxypeptidase/D-alanyl-D-alanine-endopeptidase [Flavobacteriia bacterium]
MKLIYIYILLLTTSSVFTQNQVCDALNNFVNIPSLSNASISFYAIDVKTGELVAEHHPILSLPAASTMKLFSTATAIEILGPNYRPETRIYVDGEITKDSILKGNLWIRGGGDPTLGSMYYNNDGYEKSFLYTWADTLINLGIKTITGNIIADASEFGYNGIPDGWSWSDMGNYYGAGVSGLTIYDNMIKYYFRTSSIPGSLSQLIYSTPKIENLQFHNYIEASKVNSDNSYIYGSPYSLDRFGTGALPLNSNSFLVKGSLPDPEFQFSYELYTVLKEKGIVLNGIYQSARKLDLSSIKTKYDSSYKLIYTHYGETIQSISNLTNKKSINLFAEHLLCLSGYKANNNGSIANSLKQMEKFWESKFDFTGLYIKDGSGLSRSNAVSAKHFCNLLIEMSKSPNYNVFLNTLPVAGISGTLASVCKNQPGEGRIKAKSGTINRIKAYSGYVETTTGKTIAFAIIVNNYNCSSSTLVDAMEKIFNTMVYY